MLKHSLLILVAGTLMSVSLPLTTAQDSPTTDQSASPHGMGRGHRGGPPDPAQRTQELTKQLGLTSDQQTKVQGILESERSQMEGLRQDTSISQQDRRSKMMDIRKTSDSQIRGLLDSTQQKKWDEMQAQRQHWMQGHRPAPPDGGPTQQAPPSQQE